MSRRLVVILLLLALAVAAGSTLVETTHVRVQLGEGRQARIAPVHLTADKGLYALLLSARTRAGGNGTLRVALEGAPGMNYSLFDLTALLHPTRQNRPSLRQNLLELPDGPGELELGIVLQPKPPAPADARLAPELPTCCRGAGQLDNSSLEAVADYDRPLQLRFYDPSSGQLVMKIPILIGDRRLPEEDLDDLFRADPQPPAGESGRRTGPVGTDRARAGENA